MVFAFAVVALGAGCATIGEDGSLQPSTLKGVPPLFFYTTGETGYTCVPPLLSYQSRTKEETFTVGLLGIVSIGSEKRFFDKNGVYTGMRSWDANLCGLYTTFEEETREGGVKYEKLLLGGLIGYGNDNGAGYLKLFWFFKFPDPAARAVKLKCPTCANQIIQTQKKCANCGQKLLPYK